MYFNIYDWSKSGYRNAKDQIITETRVASKSITKFRKYIDGAYEESVLEGSNGSNVDELGLPKDANYGVMSGEDYFNLCDKDIKKVQFPVDPPTVLIQNDEYYTVYYKDIINDVILSTYTDSDNRTQTNIAFKESGRFDTYIGLTSVGIEAYNAGTLPELKLLLTDYLEDVHTLTSGTGEICDVKGRFKSMPLDMWWRFSIPRITILDSDLTEPYTVPMTSASVGSLSVDPTKKFNLVPSLDLKKFLARYQSTKESPLGILPITAKDGNFSKDRYTTIEVKELLADVISKVSGMADVTFIFTHTGASKAHTNCEAEKICRSITLPDTNTCTLGTDSVVYAYNMHTTEDKLRGEINPADRVVTNYIATGTDKIAISKVNAQYTTTSTNVEKISFTHWVKNEARSTTITNTLTDIGYTEAEDRELMYNLGAVLGQINRVLPIITDHSYTVGFTKEVLLQALNNMKDMAYTIHDEYEAEVDTIVAESAIGALLKQTGDLADVLATADVEKLDYMYMSYRASLMNKINRFNDSDTMADVNQMHDLLTTRNIWKYINVYAKKTSFGYEVRAYLPNWNMLKHGNNRIATKVMSAMVTIDNHVHVKKKSWWVKVRMAVVILILVIASCASSGCTTLPSILAIVSATAGIAAAATGSDRWAKVSEIAGYASMATGIAQVGAKQGMAEYIKANGWKVVLMAITETQSHRHRKTMRSIEEQQKALEEEYDGIKERITILEAKNKVMEYINTEHITDRYTIEYDRSYNIA